MRLNNFKIVIIIIFLAALSIFSLLAGSNEREIGKACFRDDCFDVELARSFTKQQRGLMFRKSLGEKEGMLFVFKKEGEYPFWMKNTLISLDIIWINENKEVVFIEDSVYPCKEDSSCEVFNPDNKAKYVLELNGGTAEKIGLGIGGQIRLEVK